VRHLTEQGGREPNPATVRELLRYHQRTGRILAVRRGLFATVPPGSTPESAPMDAYLVGAMGCPGGVLAYHTALELSTDKSIEHPGVISSEHPPFEC
jgi:hypothetical protein